MDKNKYWKDVRIKFDKLVADFQRRCRESVDTEFLPEIRLAEIQKVWDTSDYIIGYNGNVPFYDGGPLRFAYADLVAGKRDYNNTEHLELDAYLQFEKWLNREPTFWQSTTASRTIEKKQEYNWNHVQKQNINSELQASGNAAIHDALSRQDLDTFFTELKAIFASVPYYILKKDESSFHRDIHLTLTALGFKIESEVPTNKGRIDAVIEIDSFIYILELKITDVEKALTQIKKKKYYQKYMNKGKEVILVGVVFNTADGDIVNWKSINLSN